MAELKRHLNFSRLTFYGVGDILGAGIYALVGKVAWEAGGLAWFVFLFAALAVLPTGLSYAELTSRYPKSGGASVFVGRAFRNPLFPLLIGFLVLMSGLVSSAAISNAFHGYFSIFVEIPRWVAVTLFLLFLSFVNYLGIAHSSKLNILCVVFEVTGLLLIISFGWRYWGEGDFLTGKGAALFSPETLQGIGAAVILAFYASLGFEDMCNVSEEVKEPERTVPKAILFSLLITSMIYIAIALTVVSVASREELGSSNAPLAMVAQKMIPFFSSKAVAFLALFSLANTVLANLVMGSRLLYGMSREGLIFKSLSKVDEKRQTPMIAVAVVFLLALILALSGALKILAQTSSVILLTVFIFVNLSLILVRLHKLPPDSAAPLFKIPLVVPVLGILISLFLITQAPAEVFWRFGILLAAGVLFYAACRRRYKF